jgi:hypothetical protein
MTRFAFHTALALAFAFVCAPAGAQIMGDPAGGNFSGIQGAPNIGGGREPTPAFGGHRSVVPPAGLPGAQSRPNATVLPSLPPTMLDPTQELFDAINRGDLAAARDAIGRGANVNGQNELGLTPVQISVDLGHNDITFLLLANGAGRSTASGAPGPKGKEQPGRGSKTAAILEATTRPKAGNGQSRTARVHVQSVPVADRQLPRLYANDGGAPIPSAGFLGFDQAR